MTINPRHSGFHSPKIPPRNAKHVDTTIASNYGNNTMKTTELKVARIGNSRGVRLPADTLRRYHIGGAVLMEERPEGILLHPKSSPVVEKLSWEETARQMAESQEDWSEWDATTGDGLTDTDRHRLSAHKPTAPTMAVATSGAVRGQARRNCSGPDSYAE